MKHVSLSLATLLLFVCYAFPTKIPTEAWQSGTLVSSEESWHSRTAGAINNGQGVLVGREYPIVHYVIDTPTYTYDADLVLRHPRDKQPAVTVNGPIKFAFVKSDMYVQDENGKEIKLTLTKKTLKQSH